MSAYWALIAAAGSGQRMHASRPKQYLRIAGRLIIEHTLYRLLCYPVLSGAVVVVSPGDVSWKEVNLKPLVNKPLYVAEGGPQRPISILNGLRALSTYADANDWILIHDAVRPCIDPKDIERLITELGDDPVGGLFATPVRDTLKRAALGRVSATIDRAALWHAQTPQMFRYKLLLDALQIALDAGLGVTDESQALEHAGLQPRIVQGSSANIKITHPEDLKVAETYLMRHPTNG